MKTENKIKLMKFIYTIDNLGHYNAMLRKEFKKLNKKEWRNFIDEHIKILDK
jgi:hypothetical protein